MILYKEIIYFFFFLIFFVAYFGDIILSIFKSFYIINLLGKGSSNTLITSEKRYDFNWDLTWSERK